MGPSITLPLPISISFTASPSLRIRCEYSFLSRRSLHHWPWPESPDRAARSGPVKFYAPAGHVDPRYAQQDLPPFHLPFPIGSFCQLTSIRSATREIQFGFSMKTSNLVVHLDERDFGKIIPLLNRLSSKFNQSMYLLVHKHIWFDTNKELTFIIMNHQTIAAPLEWRMSIEEWRIVESLCSINIKIMTIEKILL